MGRYTTIQPIVASPGPVQLQHPSPHAPYPGYRKSYYPSERVFPNPTGPTTTNPTSSSTSLRRRRHPVPARATDGCPTTAVPRSTWPARATLRPERRPPLPRATLPCSGRSREPARWLRPGVARQPAAHALKDRYGEPERGE
jgi:hypothetical protein